MEQWLSFAYQYGLGGGFFALTFMIMFKTGALQRERKQDLRFTFMLCGGLILFMLIHAIWIFVAGK